MALLTEEKASIVEKFKRNEGDTGSPEVQIALLRENINKLQNHFKNHNKDQLGTIICQEKQQIN